MSKFDVSRATSNLILLLLTLLQFSCQIMGVDIDVTGVKVNASLPAMEPVKTAVGLPPPGPKVVFREGNPLIEGNAYKMMIGATAGVGIQRIKEGDECRINIAQQNFEGNGGDFPLELYVSDFASFTDSTDEEREFNNTFIYENKYVYIKFYNFDATDGNRFDGNDRHECPFTTYWSSSTVQWKEFITAGGTRGDPARIIIVKAGVPPNPVTKTPIYKLQYCPISSQVLCQDIGLVVNEETQRPFLFVDTTGTGKPLHIEFAEQ